MSQVLTSEFARIHIYKHNDLLFQTDNSHLRRKRYTPSDLMLLSYSHPTLRHFPVKYTKWSSIETEIITPRRYLICIFIRGWRDVFKVIRRLQASRGHLLIETKQTVHHGHIFRALEWQGFGDVKLFVHHNSCTKREMERNWVKSVRPKHDFPYSVRIR